jgi:multiple sugar transport system permease protein
LTGLAARVVARPRLSSSLRNQEALLGFVFVGPQVIGFLTLVAGPVLAIVYFSVFRWNIIQGTLTFIGSANYERLLNSEEVSDIARTTVLFGLGFVPATVVGGLAVALAVNSRERWFIGLRAAYFVPVVISLAAWTLVWRLMLAPDGAVNGLLQWLGQAPIPWLREPGIALAALVGVQFLKSLGYSMVLFLAALQTVPRDLLDAVRVDGANRWQSFRSITLPLIAPFTLMVTILLTIASFKTFALIQLMTKGGPGHATTVLSYYIYQQGLQLFEMGYASAVAVVLFVAVLSLTIVQLLLRRWWVFEGD